MTHFIFFSFTYPKASGSKTSTVVNLCGSVCTEFCPALTGLSLLVDDERLLKARVRSEYPEFYEKMGKFCGTLSQRGYHHPLMDLNIKPHYADVVVRDSAYDSCVMKLIISIDVEELGKKLGKKEEKIVRFECRIHRKQPTTSKAMKI